MYTSGTTGLPKGALHTHDSVEWAVFTVLATADVRFLDRYLICLPLFHVGALNPLTVTIYRGGTVILMRQFDPEQIWTIFRDEQVTITLAVPAMLNFMLQTYRPDVHQPLRLRWIMSGAAPVPPSLIEEYAGLGLEIHQVYGLTETCGPACLISPDEALTHIGSTGKAFFHTDVRIVDDDGNDVGVDEPGEVLVRGRHVMAGYWNRPDETAATISDGWLHTGDIAVRDADGFVFIRDRIKDMIISGGENIYPAEIEDVLLAHPRVADVAVIGMPSAKWGSRRWPWSSPPTPTSTNTPSWSTARASWPASSSLAASCSPTPSRATPPARPSRPSSGRCSPASTRRRRNGDSRRRAGNGKVRPRTPAGAARCSGVGVLNCFAPP